MNNEKMKSFLKRDNNQNQPIIQNQVDEQLIQPRQGLIERVDKTLKTADGRTLLMESR